MRENKNRARLLGVLFMAFAAAVMVFYVITEERGTLIIQHYLSAAAFAFVGMNLLSGSYGKRLDDWLGAAVVGWYVLSRVLLGDFYLEESYRSFVDLCCVYLAALPFAHLMGDAKRKQGLKAVAAVYLAGLGVCALVALTASVLDRTFLIPWVNKSVGLPGGMRRLFVFRHPNTDGCLFLMALMLGIWLAVTVRRRWVTVGVTLLSVVFYADIALGVSRTVMLQVCCFAAGLAVLGALRLRIPALWKRLAVGVLAGALCALLLYKGFDWTVNGISQWAASLRASAETMDEPVRRVVWERSLLDSLRTLTGRTDIYRQAWQMIREQPSILLRGMGNNQLVQTLLQKLDVVNTHNAYLQALLHMGLPGLLAAIWFTVRAVTVSLRLVFARKAAFADQLLAVALLVLLLSTITECYLFTDYFTPCNLVFFLLLGYVTETARALRA